MTKCALTPDRDGLWLGMALVLVGLALFGLWQMPDRIHSDCAICLQQAELLLQGAVPYRDFVDTNPLPVVYMNVVPVVLAHLLGVSAITAFNALVIALLLASGLEIHFLLRRRRMCFPAAARGLVLLTWIALYFVIDWRGDSGQRQHLFILLYVPYLFLRILRYRGGSIAVWFAIMLGIQAGLGVALRPLFLFVAVNIEIVLLFVVGRRRTLLRPENFALASVVAAYLMHWMLVPSVMRETFFSRWLPLINYGYRIYNVGYGEVLEILLSSPVSLTALAASLAATRLCFQRRTLLRHQLVALMSLAGISLTLVFLQHTGWSCYRIPFDVAGLLCLTVLIVIGSRQWAAGHGQWTVGLRSWVVGVVVFGVLLAVWFTGRTDSSLDTPAFVELRRIVERRSQPNDRVLVVATSAGPAYPLLLQTGRRPGSRYLCSFPVALFYAGVTPPKPNRPVYRRRDEAPAEERQFLSELGDDVARRQPRLILVQNGTGWPGLPESFNTFDYLVYVGWTDEALMSYRELPGPDGWKVFERLAAK